MTLTPMISGDEFDAMTRTRKLFNWRAGVRSKIKRGYRRRLRRALRVYDVD
jgi:hypothetical protein